MIDIAINRIGYVLFGIAATTAVGIFYPHWVISIILMLAGGCFGVAAFFDDLALIDILKRPHAQKIIKTIS